MDKSIMIGLCGALVLCATISGCIEVSDWEYEHYYYIETRVGSVDEYTISIPLPSASSRQETNTEGMYVDKYIQNLKIERGNCTYSVITHESNKYLEIKGSSNLSIYSTFKLWDFLANVSIEKGPAHNTQVYSNTSNVSIIIDSRAVRKTNEKDTWDMYYSAAIDPSKNFPIPTKQAWKNHLSEENFLKIEEGWHSHSIQEMNDWNAVHIK